MSIRIGAFVALMAAGLVTPLSVAAQLIAVRTVPIYRSHQFDLFPSVRRAMGDLSIAVDDSLLDPFVNPAKGSRVGVARMFTAPQLFRVTDGAGDGRSLPVGATARVANWYGSVALAIQSVDLSSWYQSGIPVSCPVCESRGMILSGAERSHGNSYAFAALGRTFPNSGWSIGGSVFLSQLTWLHGAEFLYGGSSRIEQRGDGLDLRLGALKEWSGRSLAATLVRNRFSGSHDVLFVDYAWDSTARSFNGHPRLEENLDRTNTWGLHLEYQQRLRAPGWRFGAIATTNVMSHPKIPNYVFQRIPRDPGNSEAFNVGIGLFRQGAQSAFGIELVHEPIWSHTWADAAIPVTTSTGGLIPAGGKTIENRFRFSNNVLRFGFGHDFQVGTANDAIGLQLGLSAHDIRYTLAQQDLVAGTDRHLNEGWTEWTSTWGFSVRTSGIEVRYRGNITGTRFSDIFGISGGGDDVTIAEPGPSIVAAPGGPLAFTGPRVTSHQLSIVVPIH